LYKPHKANDIRWEAIQAVRAREGMLEMRHFRILKRLGSGDIGNVYPAELSGTRTSFAMKLMNKTELATRKKLLRAQTWSYRTQTTSVLLQCELVADPLRQSARGTKQTMMLE